MRWYEEDVMGAIATRNQLNYEPETIFYGSSTIRLWDSLYTDFERYKPINLGFGGSTLAACAWFFDEIVAPVTSAKKFILYAGDNDLGDGRHPEEVCLFYRYFLIKLRQHFKEIPLFFISVKPSIDREDIMDKIGQTNKLIKDEIERGNGNEFYIDIFNKMVTRNNLPLTKFFDADGLHLNAKGYDVLKEAIQSECLSKEE